FVFGWVCVHRYLMYPLRRQRNIVIREMYKLIDNYSNANNQEMQLGLKEYISKNELSFLSNGVRQGSVEMQKRIKHSYYIYLKMQRKDIGNKEVLE
uniref:hypothetical protein n=1 Tax=Escherichia coli TaxID=562 RepID=UPI0005C57D0B